MKQDNGLQDESGGAGGGNGRRKGRLSAYQRDFMRALQAAVNAAGGPASVPEIVSQLQKSDSRVRSHIKRLLELGYVCCVGKAKRTSYVPSSKWLDEPEVEEGDCICVGGHCEQTGCNNLAEAYYGGHYVCRSCLVGERGDPTGRQRYYDNLGIPSSASELILEAPGTSRGKPRRRRRRKQEREEVHPEKLVVGDWD